uniref:Uncharacterized protein n=1 Tax=Setaria digitata TaxID=48799 RepID=A0A915Q5G1_9BILA
MQNVRSSYRTFHFGTQGEQAVSERQVQLAIACGTLWKEMARIALLCKGKICSALAVRCVFGLFVQNLEKDGRKPEII